MDGFDINKLPKVNYVFEFKTPNGYLPIGVDYNSLQIIFDYLNELEYEHATNVYRTGYTYKFEILKNSASTYDVLTLGEFGVPKKAVFELTDEQIKNDINLFCVDSSHEETIYDYVKRTDFTKIFSEKTKSYFQNNSNFKLVILDNKEGTYFFDNYFFDSLFNFYNKIGLSSDNQIIFITNTCNVNDMYQRYLSNNKIPSFMKVQSIEFLVYDPGQTISDYFQQTDGKSDIIVDKNVEYSVPCDDELNEIRSKYFLFLNRNSGRLHRAKLLLEFIKNNLFEKSITSFLHSNEFDEFCEKPENYEYKTLIKEKYPFVADFEDPYFVSDMHNFFTKKEMWMDTYFSVVSETSADDKWCFITEKTIRPIIYYHPFIVWGNPGTLKVLREIGFETFPEFFDESYDGVYDSNARLKMILDEVKKLCSLPIEDIHNLYQTVKPKLVHNRELLVKLHKTKQLHTKFFKTLL